ncbi:MAG TPA: hypothetical protein VJU86_11540 [Pyrinomonadaceae bacterium]|nr:hypothetical protein [Pyrinomonadaceae bacterium]
MSDVPDLLGVDPGQGLTEYEVMIRRGHYKANKSGSWRGRRETTVSLMLFSSIFIGFLTTAAVLSSAIADSVEAFSLILVTALGAIVGFVSLLKSARAFDVMEEVTGTYVCVKRGGHDIETKAEELVPGDVIILKTGEYVPADCRLLESDQLRVDESALTGKSASIEKDISAVPLNTGIGQRRSMLFLGTKILSGSALAAVVTTGLQTELGKRAAGDQ